MEMRLTGGGEVEHKFMKRKKWQVEKPGDKTGFGMLEGQKGHSHAVRKSGGG